MVYTLYLFFLIWVRISLFPIEFSSGDVSILSELIWVILLLFILVTPKPTEWLLPLILKLTSLAIYAPPVSIRSLTLTSSRPFSFWISFDMSLWVSFYIWVTNWVCVGVILPLNLNLLDFQVICSLLPHSGVCVSQKIAWLCSNQDKYNLVFGLVSSLRFLICLIRLLVYLEMTPLLVEIIYFLKRFYDEFKLFRNQGIW